MTAPLVLADPVIDLLPWTKTQAQLAPLHGGRVYWRFPTGLKTYPAIRLYDAVPPLIPPSGGGLPMVEAHVAFDIWADPEGDGTDFPAVKQIATTIVAVFHDMAPGTLIGNTLVKNADATTAVFSPDPETGCARYVIGVSIYATTPN